MNPENKPRISHGTLARLDRCAHQEEMHRTYGPVPPGVAQTIGKAGHAAVAVDLQHKIDTGALLPDDDFLDSAAESFEAKWAEESPELTSTEKSRGAQKVRGEAKDRTLSASAAHHEIIAPTLEPFAVERRIDIELQGFPYDLSGWEDVAEEAGPRDTKFSAKSPQADLAEKSIQLDLYSLAHTVCDEKPAVRQAFDYVVSLKKGPKVVQLEAPATTNFEPLFRRVEIAAQILDSGLFMPTDPSNWVCQKKHCGWFDRCPFGAARRMSVAVGDKGEKGCNS